MSIVQEIPIARPETMVEAVTHALIKYISSNRLGPGDRLPTERQLVRMTGASRLPLREALSALKGLGIIESWQGKGMFVKQLDLSTVFSTISPLLKTHAEIDLQHIFDARLPLEMSIAEMAAAHRTEEHLQTLGHEIEQMRATVRDRTAYVQHDTRFHQELSRATGNPVFVVFMASVLDLLEELQFLYRDRIVYRTLALREHEAILDAVTRQDAARARQAVEEHLRNATKRF